MSAGNDREFIDHLQNKEGKEQAMKCPVLREQWRVVKGKDISEWADCLKEKCALWDKGIKDCGFHAAKEALQMIALCLRDIKDKMPHAGQFKK